MKKEAIHINKKRIPWFRYSWGDRIFLLITYTILTLMAFICLYPMYYTVIASFSDTDAVYLGQTFLWIKGFNTNAYEAVFQTKDIWIGYGNSIIYTVFGTFFNLVLTIPAAYALSRKEMLGRKVIMKIMLVTMYFGGGMIPTYLLHQSLGLVNNPLVMIISGGVSVYNIIVTRTFFQNNVPESLYEAARIDGAGEFKIFLRVAVPLSGAIVAVIALYYAVGHWNDYFTALLYLKKTDYHPLEMVIRRIIIQNQNRIDDALQGALSPEAMEALRLKKSLAVGMKFALVIISSAPMLIFYPFIQKYFVKGVMIGSVKE